MTVIMRIEGTYFWATYGPFTMEIMALLDPKWEVKNKGKTSKKPNDFNTLGG